MKRLLGVVLPVLLCILFVVCSIFFTNDIHSDKKADGDDSSETIDSSTNQFADEENRQITVRTGFLLFHPAIQLSQLGSLM